MIWLAVEKLGILPDALNDVPVAMLAEIAAFYQWQDEERTRAEDEAALDKGRAFTREMLGEDDEPATLGGQ